VERSSSAKWASHACARAREREGLCSLLRIAPTRPEASVGQSACDHSESAYAVLLLILSHCWVVAVGGLCVCLFAAVWVDYLCRCCLRRHRHVPKAILKASRLKTVVKEAKQRKEENVRLRHSRWSAHGCPHTRMQNTAHAHADRGCPRSPVGSAAYGAQRAHMHLCRRCGSTRSPGPSSTKRRGRRA
jgi:hypothetical protein